MTHLTTTEIEEAVRQQLLTPNQQQHLDLCSSCQTTYQQTQRIFDTMHAAQAPLNPSADLWDRIESSYKQQNMALHSNSGANTDANGSSNKHLNTSPKKSFNWKPWTMASIAASLLIVIGIQWKQLDQTQHQQYQLQAMMLESQLLEKSLKQSQFQQTTQSLEIIQLKMQLTQIDTQLQQAYMHQQDFTEIKTLWQSRIALLQQIQQLSSQSADVMAI